MLINKKAIQNDRTSHYSNLRFTFTIVTERHGSVEPCTPYDLRLHELLNKLNKVYLRKISQGEQLTAVTDSLSGPTEL